MLASGTRAPIDPNHQDDVPHVFACSRKRQAMPLPKLSHPVCLQPPCASSCSLAWTDIVFRDRKDRPERVLCVGLASFGPLMGCVAEKQKYSNVVERLTCRYRPLGADFVHVSRMLIAWFNVEIWPSPAFGSWIYVLGACLVGFMMVSEHEHICRDMPCGPHGTPWCKSVM